MDPIEAKRRKMEERLRQKRARQDSERLTPPKDEALEEVDEDLEVLEEVEPLAIPDDDDDLGLDEDEPVDLDDDDLEDADDDELDDLEDALAEDSELETQPAVAGLDPSELAPTPDLDPAELVLPPGDDDDLGLDPDEAVDLDGTGTAPRERSSCENCAATELRLEAVKSLVRGLQQLLQDEQGDPGSILAEVAVSLGSLLEARDD